MREGDIWTSVPFEHGSLYKDIWHDNVPSLTSSVTSSEASFDSNNSIFSTSMDCPSFQHGTPPLKVALASPSTPPKQSLDSPSTFIDDVPLADLLKNVAMFGKSADKGLPKPFITSNVPAGGRYVRVSNLPTSLLPNELATYLQHHDGVGPVRGVLTDHLSTYGFVILAFFDVRHAVIATERLRYERGFSTALDVECMNRDELIQYTSMAHKIQSESEGQVRISISSLTQLSSPTFQHVQAAICASTNADLSRDLACMRVEHADHNAMRVSCTFFDDRLATSAVLSLQGATMYGCRFSASFDKMPVGPTRSHESALVAEDLSSFVNPFMVQRNGNKTRLASSQDFSPTIGYHQFQTLASPLRGRHAVPDDNVVDLEAIELGLDVRTTIMLKNLPNRMTDVRLYEIVSQVTPRAFDFLYLRVDFATGSSVGYSFINFLSPQDVLRFGRARLGTRWDPVASEKQVFMSYANIQGKLALIAKFRNSAVMDQREAYRPKIFHSSGPMVGLPEPFPAPDDDPAPNRRLAASRSAPLLCNQMQLAQSLSYPSRASCLR